MSNINFDLTLDFGYKEEMLLNFDVDYYMDSTGDIEINDYYAYNVTKDLTNHRIYDKVPDWLHTKLASTVEDYKYDMISELDQMSA